LIVFRAAVYLAGMSSPFSYDILPTQSSAQHYVSTVISSWNAYAITKASVRIYKSGLQAQFINFNASSDPLSWFSPGNVQSSSWTDIPPPADQQLGFIFQSTRCRFVTFILITIMAQRDVIQMLDGWESWFQHQTIAIQPGSLVVFLLPSLSFTPLLPLRRFSLLSHVQTP
jgi:hypothetical protein